MQRKLGIITFLCFLTGSWNFSIAQEPVDLLVADFDNAQKVNNLNQKIEVWLMGDGSDKTQNCQMSFVDDDALGAEGGHSVRLDYDVESENPAYNGIRTDLGLLDPKPYKSLNFYLKGDAAAGFTKKLKIELIGQGKPPSPHILDGITGQWQLFTIPLEEFWVIQSGSPLEKFVVVFSDITNDPKTGTIYLDHIYFSKEQ